MPNSLSSTGLQIKSSTELINDLVTAFQQIYGTDINLEQNSPDGQLVNIIGQAASDILELMLAVYNTFTVDGSFGTILDQRVAINGLARRQASNTIIAVDVTASAGFPVLNGLDNSFPTVPVFTISDSSGNKFQLIAGTILDGFGGPNVFSLNFQAFESGDVEVGLNTVTNIVTATAGITVVNNPTIPVQVGADEESDAELRLRHARSFYLASTGAADSIQAALLASPGVLDALVVENPTSGVVNTIPAYSIWCIVDGGADAVVAAAIYAKKAPGCPMKGSSSFTVSRPNGTSFVAKFDRPLATRLYVRFTLTARSPGLSFDTTAIKKSLVTNLFFKLNQPATVNDVIVAMFTIEPRAILSVVGVSTDNAAWFDIINPSDYQHRFSLATGDITIS